MNQGYVGGWRYDLDFEENRLQRLLSKLQSDDLVMSLTGSFEEVSLDPRAIMKVENQGQVGACQGHSISSCCEWCYVIATGGQTEQLSRAYGYYESQRLDNITGDRGSTVEAGIDLATKYGICPESMWPYTGRYEPTRPRPIEELRAAAAQYKIGSSTNLKSYDAIRTFLGGGMGAVHLGITWNDSVNRAVVNNYSAAQGGGHSIGLYSLSDRKDAQGRPYIWMMNSWSPDWGAKGWAEWAPSAITQMLQSRYAVFIGVSDMPAVKPRKFSLEDWQKGLRI